MERSSKAAADAVLPNCRLIRARDYEDLSQHAARLIFEAMRNKPDLLLCAATGDTPTGTYRLLADTYRESPDAFNRCRVLKLDEWGGIEMDDAGSCEHYLQRQLIRPLEIEPHRCFGFQSNPPDRDEECERVRRWISEAGPIDLCVLGLGINGHIALNEPGAALQPYAHVAQLSASTLLHPMLAKARQRPACGLTLGMAEILGSAQILLLVSGASKRSALQRLLTREITTDFPASFLWLHQNWTLLCDQEAGGEDDELPTKEVSAA